MSDTGDKTELANFIASQLSAMLGQEVSPEANFAALGMDSLDAVTLIDALADRLGEDELPVTLVVDFPTAQALATHLTECP